MSSAITLAWVTILMVPLQTLRKIQVAKVFAWAIWTTRNRKTKNGLNAAIKICANFWISLSQIVLNVSAIDLIISLLFDRNVNYNTYLIRIMIFVYCSYRNDWGKYQLEWTTNARYPCTSGWWMQASTVRHFLNWGNTWRKNIVLHRDFLKIIESFDAKFNMCVLHF